MARFLPSRRNCLLGVIGAVVISAGLGCWLWLWANQIHPRLTMTCTTHGYPACIAISPKGNSIACGFKDAIELWDVATGKVALTIKPAIGEVTALAFSSDGDALAAGAAAGEIALWNTSTGKLLNRFVADSEKIESLIILPDGQTVASATAAGGTLWHWPAGKRLWSLNPDESHVTINLAASSDGKWLAACSGVGVTVWDLGKRQRVKYIDSDRQVFAVGFSPHSNDLAFKPQRSRVAIWNCDTRQYKATLIPENLHWGDESKALAFSSDGELLASTDLGQVLVWDLKSQAVRATLKAATKEIAALAFTPDGRSLISAALEGKVCVWDLADIPAATFRGPPQPAFDGSSENLKRSVVLPTLDTPIPGGKSAIWCSSFQIAWNRLKTDITKAPIELSRKDPMVDRLNGAPETEADLPKDSFYCAAGSTNDGIVERIKKELPLAFPGARVPDLSAPQLPAVIACGYLRAGVKFTYDFFDSDDLLLFVDSAGHESKVRAFGIRAKDRATGGHTFRRQIDVLFRDKGEFALDLSKTSSPNQIIVARMARKPTLGATLEDIEHRPGTGAGEFSDVATLLVPNLEWRIEHDFRELDAPGNCFLNAAIKDYIFYRAFQSVKFRLDRHGAELESAAVIVTYNDGHDDPNAYHFDSPFLIVLKKRGAAHPFFVMWVDNDELLCTK